MKDSNALLPANVVVASGLPATMQRERISVRELLLAFNDPEEETPIDAPVERACASEQATLYVRERTIGGRRVAVLYQRDAGAKTWELLHCTAWKFVH